MIEVVIAKTISRQFPNEKEAEKFIKEVQKTIGEDTPISEYEVIPLYDPNGVPSGSKLVLIKEYPEI